MSRIVKGGRLEPPLVLDSLREAISVESRDFAWTVVDTKESLVASEEKSQPYLAGKLVKYDPDAMVEVVDETSRKTRLLSEPNMQRASSMFVYLPDEAIFCHRNVWNEIGGSDFRGRIAELVVGYYKEFFVDCELQPVVDLQRFLSQLRELDEVTELKARVSPPNPLFGVFWSELKDYVEQRRLRQLAIKETATSGKSLPTMAPEIARRIETETIEELQPVPIGDAAVLMAADGYGSAELSGRRGTTPVVITTKNNVIQLKLDADITATELAEAVVRELDRLRKMRKWSHS